jgi:hypothetical protein
VRFRAPLHQLLNELVLSAFFIGLSFVDPDDTRPLVVFNALDTTDATLPAIVVCLEFMSVNDKVSFQGTPFHIALTDSVCYALLQIGLQHRTRWM